VASQKLKLEIESRPISTWGITLASRLPRAEWDSIRKRVYQRANYKCEICGEDCLQLHCHEQWGFDNRKRIQYLKDLRCVCETCHDVIHFGRSKHVYPKSYVNQLVRHWCEVNGKSQKDFEKYQAAIHTKNKARANIFYKVVAFGKTLT